MLHLQIKFGCIRTSTLKTNKQQTITVKKLHFPPNLTSDILNLGI